MTSLKRSFSKKKKISTDFSDILVGDVKMMLGKVLKVSRRYMPPFLSYRENPSGGRRNSPPPSGARVKLAKGTRQGVDRIKTNIRTLFLAR